MFVRCLSSLCRSVFSFEALFALALFAYQFQNAPQLQCFGPVGLFIGVVFLFATAILSCWGEYRPDTTCLLFALFGGVLGLSSTIRNDIYKHFPISLLDLFEKE
jgi:prepilin signal peptidase PulO-like enzyme (type II secretory pathway)